MTPKEIKKLDKAISKAWSVQASGVQVNIMNIGKIFAMVRDVVASGGTVESGINDAIKLFREN